MLQKQKKRPEYNKLTVLIVSIDWMSYYWWNGHVRKSEIVTKKPDFAKFTWYFYQLDQGIA